MLYESAIRRREVRSNDECSTGCDFARRTSLIVLASLLLFSMSLLNAKRPPIFTDVHIGSDGPYRFLVDTGAQTSLIDPKLAAKLGLQPEFRVEMVTEQSTVRVPGLNVRTLKLGNRALPATEVVFQPVEEARTA